jgi:hypothetical protein
MASIKTHIFPSHRRPRELALLRLRERRIPAGIGHLTHGHALSGNPYWGGLLSSREGGPIRRRLVLAIAGAAA